MAKRNRRPPHRTATRTDGALRVVRDDGLSIVSGNAPSVVVQDLVETAEVTAGVATSIAEALRSARHRLDAELVLASMFGMLGEGLAEEMHEPEGVSACVVLLSGMIQHCEQMASPGGLAFLRLAAEQGPAICRQAAGEAATRLAESGIPDQRWATAGPLKVLRAWHFGDIYGMQASLGVLFSYGNREHALCVLIDHDLGGGIKDARFAEGRNARGMRDQAARGLAAQPEAVFEDITEKDALDGLRSALISPPCPVSPDQVKAVGSYLYLVHARAQQLARMLDEPPVDLYADTIADSV